MTVTPIDEQPMVLVSWSMPPERADDGGWFCTFKVVELPLGVALSCEQDGRCERIADG